MSGKIRLDIACGAAKPDGWVGIDVAKAPRVDVVHDIFQFPWPVEPGSVEEARCIHFVEHIPHREAPYVEVDASGAIEMLAQDRWARSIRRWGHVRDLWWDFWEQVHRALAPDATITVVTPFYSSSRADQDPTHERRICEKSYEYLNQAWLRENRCCYPYVADFEVVDMKYLVLGERDVSQEDVGTRINAVDDLLVVLRAKKPSGCWWEVRA